MLGPPLLIGEKVFYTKHGFIASGTVKWLGRLQEVFGNQMVAGVLMVRETKPLKNVALRLLSWYTYLSTYCQLVWYALSGIPIQYPLSFNYSRAPNK